MTTILVTGGTGNTGSRVTRRLRDAGLDVRVGSRHPRDDCSVAFDWTDPETFDQAFAGTEAVYLVAPTGVFDAIGAMQPALDRARALGVRRFVLLSASAIACDGVMMGKVHAYLASHARQVVVLRPSWFMQNFTLGPHAATARAEGAIYSATGDGAVPIIDAEDIAAVAAAALLADTDGTQETILTGPQALTYDAIAAAMGRHLRRPVRHVRLTADALAARYAGAGLPQDYAEALARMDEAIAAGGADRVTDEVRRWSGSEPAPFETVLVRDMPVEPATS